jgi:hypothetical protein
MYKRPVAYATEPTPKRGKVMITPPFKYLKSYLVNALFITPEKLYREFGQISKNVNQITEGKLYFIVKRPKVRFKDNVQLTKKCELKYKYKGQSFFSKKKIIPLSNIILCSQSGFKKDVLPESVKLQKNLRYIENANEADFSGYKKELVYVFPSTGDIERVNRAFTFELIFHSGSKIKQIQLTIFAHQLLRMTNKHIVKCEILYIGKANELINRTNQHKHVQQAQSECSDDDEIYLYFFTPKFEVLAVNQSGSRKIPKDFKTLTQEKRVLICEAGYINYFKPEMNSQHKNSNITKSDTLLWLRQNKYTHLAVQCIFDEEDYFFETAVTSRGGKHENIYPIATNKKTNLQKKRY